jgi:spore germination cell wall hydrolase CwlJ-like protein
MEKSLRLIAYVAGFIAVVYLVQMITTSKFTTLKAQNGYYSQDVISIKTRERQLDCLAMNIYREAGYENFEGKVAVAQVTLNSRVPILMVLRVRA